MLNTDIFKDPKLEQLIRSILDKQTGELELSEEELSHIRKIEGINLGISDLSGIKYCTKLQHLNLNGNHVKDLSPLMESHNLFWLQMDDNPIGDISPLSKLTALAHINMDGCQISDISPLSGLPNLYKLFLSRNSITDVSPLNTLIELRDLELHNNPVEDISVFTEFEKFPQISYIGLDNVQIMDIAPIGYLSGLSWLSLRGNRVLNDISPLRNLLNLNLVCLQDTNIKDISPLRDLLKLNVVFLQGTNVTDFSPVAHVKDVFR